MRGRNEHEYLAAHGIFRRRARQSTGEPEHTYSAPVRTIQPGEGITLPLAAALAWLLR